MITTTTTGSSGPVPEITDSRWMIDGSDESLLLAYSDLTVSIAAQQNIAGHYEQELLRRMAERGATSIPSTEFVCEVKQTDTYSQPGFTPLREILSGMDLDTCFVPAHTERIQVADKWNTVKVKALARRYGDEALAIVERARIPGAPRLKFASRMKELCS